MTSLIGRGIFALLAGIVLPAALFLAWPSPRVIEHEFEEVREKNLLIATNVANQLGRYHNDIVMTFEYFAATLREGAKIPDPDKLLRNLNFRHVCVAQVETGKVERGLLTNHVQCPDTIPTERFSHFTEISIPGQTVMSGVLPSPDGKPTLYIVRREGKFLIVGAINTDFFVEVGKNITFGLRGHAAIVDRSGKILSHPLPDWVEQMKDISKVSVVQKMLEGQTGVETFYSPALKDDMIAAYATVTPSGWGVMVPQPLAELQTNASDVNSAFLVYYLIVQILILSVIAAYFVPFARSVRRIGDYASATLQGQNHKPPHFHRAFIPREVPRIMNAINDLGGKLTRLQTEAADAASAADKDFSGFAHSVRSTLNRIRYERDRIEGRAYLIRNTVGIDSKDKNISDNADDIITSCGNIETLSTSKSLMLGQEKSQNETELTDKVILVA